jgi:hypothetical protein
MGADSSVTTVPRRYGLNTRDMISAKGKDLSEECDGLGCNAM